MTGPYDFIDPDRPERKRAVQRTNEATETEKGWDEHRQDAVPIGRTVDEENEGLLNRLWSAIGGFFK
jgi:hypothetical protein